MHPDQPVLNGPDLTVLLHRKRIWLVAGVLLFGMAASLLPLAIVASFWLFAGDQGAGVVAAVLALFTFLIALFNGGVMLVLFRSLSRNRRWKIGRDSLAFLQDQNTVVARIPYEAIRTIKLLVYPWGKMKDVGVALYAPEDVEPLLRPFLPVGHHGGVLFRTVGIDWTLQAAGSDADPQVVFEAFRSRLLAFRARQRRQSP